MKKCVGFSLAAGLVFVGIATVSLAQDVGGKPALRYGADLRLREEAFDNFLGVRPGWQVDNNYFRIRPRVWGEYDLDDNLTVRARAVNEFRHYLDPDKEDGIDQEAVVEAWDFPDELVFDHLYADIRDLAGGNLDLRIGRQDLIYGTGKVILEGTPGDGSRTIYFNALKASWTGIENTTVDVFGIYNPGEDPLAIENEDRNITAYRTADTEEPDESGGGVYVMNKSSVELPFELYGIYKNEADYLDPKTTNNVQSLDVWTAGGRLMPVLTDTLKGNLEAAYQMGSRGDVDVQGFMVDAFLNQALPMAQEMKPSVEAGFYWLSGDDPSTTDEEAWNPLWARYPQNSELLVFWYPAGRWTNLMMPKASFVCSPTQKVKTTAMAGYLLADEDNAAGDNERGWLGVVKGEFALADGLFSTGTHKDKLTGHLWLEVFEPGDYYTAENTDTAYFARWELMYTF